MQLLVSDYDGTLNPSCNPFRIRNLQLNIDAIREFRDNGNKFMISTGVLCLPFDKRLKNIVFRLII